MNAKSYQSVRGGIAIFSIVLLGSCASLDPVIESPHVNLRNVQVTAVTFDRQSFLLAFDVVNPNPFPLPVNRVHYGVELDGHKFASGDAAGDFTVAAESDGTFAISVDINLLHKAPQLLLIVRSGVNRDIPYRLRGEMDVKMPVAQTVRFQSDGRVNLSSGTF